MNSDMVQFALQVFVTLTAIMNPIAKTTIFMSVVGDKDGEEQKHIALKSCIVGTIILLGFVLLGKYIFQMFSITISAFQITGGLLIFYIGFNMLMSKSGTPTGDSDSDNDNDNDNDSDSDSDKNKKVNNNEAQAELNQPATAKTNTTETKKKTTFGEKLNRAKESKKGPDLAISPLAIPIIAGPGTIVTAMNHATNASFIQMAIVVVIVLVLMVVTYLCFVASERLVAFLGQNLITVFSKLMGFILAIMGSSLVLAGIHGSFGI